MTRDAAAPAQRGARPEEGRDTSFADRLAQIAALPLADQAAAFDALRARLEAELDARPAAPAPGAAPA